MPDVTKADPVWGEMMNAVVMLVIGAFLLLPVDTFSLTTYAVLNKVMHETTWGVLFIIVGFLNFLSVTFASPCWRKRLALGMTFLWSMMATAFIRALPIGILPPIIVCFAVNSALIYFQIGRQTTVR